jgi:transposase
MRGSDVNQAAMFSYVSPEQRIPADHPIRVIRQMVNEALDELTDVFTAMYAEVGRPSIPPEKLLRALVLGILYSVRSDRQLMEQLDYNLMFRWFVGLNVDEPVWDASTFSKNRDRLLEGKVAAEFFDQVLKQAWERGLVSAEHFTVDGTLLESWASLKSFQKKEGPGRRREGGGSNPEVNFRGEQRRNDTHESTTDSEARLARKGDGKEARLCYAGHAMRENRNGLIVNVRVTQAHGKAEREAAQEMVADVPGQHPITVGADKGYDTHSFVAELRKQRATPHVAQKKKGSAIDGRTTRHAGYRVSQNGRSLIEQIFGWMKTVGGQRKLRHRGRDLVGWMFELTAATYNLVRMRKLIQQPA